jgi:hypothetical protein
MKLTPKHKTRLKRIILSLTILTLTYTSLYFWSIQHNITIDAAEKIAYGEALRYCIDNKLSEDCRGKMVFIAKIRTNTMKYIPAYGAYDDGSVVFSISYIIDVNPDKRETIEVIMDLNGEGAHIDHKTIDYTKTRVSH